MPVLETSRSRGVCGNISVGLSPCKKFGSLLEKYRLELELDTEESIHKLKHLCNVDFNFSFTGWWDHHELSGKWRQGTSVPYINKDTHPPFSRRFNTKHQPGLDLQTTLLCSHPPPVTQHAKALALWFWWLFQSPKVILTLWAVPAGSCA